MANTPTNSPDQEANSRWAACLEELKQQLPEHVFITWIRPLQVVSYADHQLTLRVPNDFFRDKLEESILPFLAPVLRKNFGNALRLRYYIPKDLPADNAGQVSVLPKKDNAPAKDAPPLDPQLNPICTFDNFVVGVANKVAHTMALSIADNPDQQTFNPFFLYGPSGVGKTHLVNAIGVRMRQRYPERRILYVSAHVFRTQYTDSVRRNTTNDFIHFYQTIDLLIIDDFQEITTAKTQQAFFHIFNHLQQNRRKIVITSDRPPSEFEGIEERMLTRLKWGAVVELERPDIALRRAILQRKIRRDGLTFPREVINYIAENVTDNVRDLQGAVSSIMAFSLADEECDISLDLARRCVSRIVNVAKKELTFDTLLVAVCQHTGVKSREVNSKSRKQGIVAARQLTMYLCHKYTEMSYSQIGRTMGGRDHSTVLHACAQIERRLSIDKAYRREIEELEGGLKK